ncbi:unnamed protein product [Pleuronectes platessa]|uniref:Uncharacterized protein n=1 Tax=Pleuronectes platessa TaxID=8262 RepID=A0A9N7TQI7_PLEPL|nr:unnamed protein product [Pleuronectes platessa]
MDLPQLSSSPSSSSSSSSSSHSERLCEEGKRFRWPQAAAEASLSSCLCDEASVSGTEPTTASVICAQEDPNDEWKLDVQPELRGRSQRLRLGSCGIQTVSPL